MNFIKNIIITLPIILFSQSIQFYGADNFIKIGDNLGGFEGFLESGDRFGRDHDVIGDVNGDGVFDLVIGARSDDDGEIDAGAVYILFMNSDGTVQSHQKISMLMGGFEETLLPSSYFGYGVAGIGDYDNDNIPDIAVSAPTPENKALYIIHLNSNGTVKSVVKNENIIGQGLSAIGDINGDGRIDLVGCNPGSNDGGNMRGSIDLLFLNSNSQVITENTVTISSTQGGFGEGLSNGDQFGGREVAMLGDIDGDGTLELAVGAFRTGNQQGAIWILSLNSESFNVESKNRITQNESGFNEILPENADFGHALCNAGDLNNDGIPDLFTGANQLNEGYGYILYLNSDKTVKSYTRINNNEGGFNLNLEPTGRFSRSISFIGDLGNNGQIAINVGGGAGESGLLFLLFYQQCNFNLQDGYNYWSGGNTLFSNWNHSSQSIIGEPLFIEQCMTKSFELNANYMTHNPVDNRCILKDSTAILTESNEESFAYIKNCDFSILYGDVNNDGLINIVDIVIIVNLVLSNEYNDIADGNGDQSVDVLDIIIFINLILGE